MVQPCKPRTQGYWEAVQVVAVLDSNYIRFLKPTECPSSCYNHKGLYSVLIQGVVNS